MLKSIKGIWVVGERNIFSDLTQIFAVATEANIILSKMFKMGYMLTAIIMIQVEGDHMVEVENEIAKESNVLSVYDITGEYDAIVFAKFRDNAALNGFLKKLLTERYIKRTTTLVALNAVKEFSKII